LMFVKKTLAMYAEMPTAMEKTATENSFDL
jgi:hypothetical protein